LSFDFKTQGQLIIQPVCELIFSLCATGAKTVRYGFSPVAQRREGLKLAKG